RGRQSSAGAQTHVFVGVPGCGKSTVLCKMLTRAALIESQAATVYQLDAHVSNLSSQPGVYTEITAPSFERFAPMRLEPRSESVFVDLPGVALSDPGSLRQIRSAIEPFGVPTVHLVLNGAYEAVHLLDQVRFFSSLGISDLIVTHLDEEPRWGKLWN